MYDILQLNGMLLPELLDIAEQLTISGAKKLDKQGMLKDQIKMMKDQMKKI